MWAARILSRALQTTVVSLPQRSSILVPRLSLASSLSPRLSINPLIRSFATATNTDRQPRRSRPPRRQRDEEEQEEEEEFPDIDSLPAAGEKTYQFVTQVPKDDFSRVTDKIPRGKDFKVAPEDPALFKNYSIPTEFQYLNKCPMIYTHREYVGVGRTRGGVVPGVAKVQMRMKLDDIEMTEGQKKYLIALAGLRIRKGELHLNSDTYPAPLDNVRAIYHLASRLFEEAMKADAIDTAIAAGRNPDTDPEVQKIELANKEKEAERKAAEGAENQRLAEEEKVRKLEAKQAKQAARQEALRKKKEEEEKAAAAAAALETPAEGETESAAKQ